MVCFCVHPPCLDSPSGFWAASQTPQISPGGSYLTLNICCPSLHCAGGGGGRGGIDTHTISHKSVTGCQATDQKGQLSKGTALHTSQHGCMNEKQANTHHRHHQHGSIQNKKMVRLIGGQLRPHSQSLKD